MPTSSPTPKELVHIAQLLQDHTLAIFTVTAVMSAPATSGGVASMLISGKRNISLFALHVAGVDAAHALVGFKQRTADPEAFAPGTEILGVIGVEHSGIAYEGVVFPNDVLESMRKDQQN